MDLESSKERVKIGDKEKWEAERRNLCLAAQEGVHFPNTTIDRLVIYKDQTSGLLMCGGRIRTYNEDHRAVPLLHFQAWISTLLARAAHSEGHDGVAGTLLRMRKKAWVIRGRIIAQKVVQCVVSKNLSANIGKLS